MKKLIVLVLLFATMVALAGMPSLTGGATGGEPTPTNVPNLPPTPTLVPANGLEPKSFLALVQNGPTLVPPVPPTGTPTATPTDLPTPTPAPYQETKCGPLPEGIIDGFYDPEWTSIWAQSNAIGWTGPARIDAMENEFTVPGGDAAVFILTDHGAIFWDQTQVDGHDQMSACHTNMAPDENTVNKWAQDAQTNTGAPNIWIVTIIDGDLHAVLWAP